MTSESSSYRKDDPLEQLNILLENFQKKRSEFRRPKALSTAAFQDALIVETMKDEQQPIEDN